MALHQSRGKPDTSAGFFLYEVTQQTKKGPAFLQALILYWYRERDLNSQEVALGGF